MDFSGFDEAENPALGKAREIRNRLRRSHPDKRAALPTKPLRYLRHSQQDNGFFDFKRDFRFLFHLV